jgi:hypothetical protein
MEEEDYDNLQVSEAQNEQYWFFYLSPLLKTFQLVLGLACLIVGSLGQSEIMHNQACGQSISNTNLEWKFSYPQWYSPVVYHVVERPRCSHV